MTRCSKEQAVRRYLYQIEDIGDIVLVDNSYFFYGMSISLCILVWCDL
uniref:Uncharacterized protein n=1 Tax=Leersia perrieri TaxID=77586 RepID=A0A0D9XH94_9ORYZ